MPKPSLRSQPGPRALQTDRAAVACCPFAFARRWGRQDQAGERRIPPHVPPPHVPPPRPDHGTNSSDSGHVPAGLGMLIPCSIMSPWGCLSQPPPPHPAIAAPFCPEPPAPPRHRACSSAGLNRLNLPRSRQRKWVWTVNSAGPAPDGLPVLVGTVGPVHPTLLQGWSQSCHQPPSILQLPGRTLHFPRINGQVLARRAPPRLLLAPLCRLGWARLFGGCRGRRENNNLFFGFPSAILWLSKHKRPGAVNDPVQAKRPRPSPSLAAGCWDRASRDEF